MLNIGALNVKFKRSRKIPLKIIQQHRMPFQNKKNTVTWNWAQQLFSFSFVVGLSIALQRPNAIRKQRGSRFDEMVIDQYMVFVPLRMSTIDWISLNHSLWQRFFIRYFVLWICNRKVCVWNELLIFTSVASYERKNKRATDKKMCRKVIWICVFLS